MLRYGSMERRAFQTWLAAAEQLTDAQKAEAGEVLSKAFGRQGGGGGD